MNLKESAIQLGKCISIGSLLTNSIGRCRSGQGNPAQLILTSIFVLCLKLHFKRFVKEKLNQLKRKKLDERLLDGN